MTAEWEKPLGKSELRELFPEEQLPFPPDGVFEVGLVLAGTVSAGAYTAGVLDLLIEALDTWYLAKQQGGAVPPHDVRLKIAAGASGGGSCAAILARALPFAWPHVHAGMGENDPAIARNPFYDVWVNSLDISGFTDTGDLAVAGDAFSILNTGPIDQAGRTIVDMTGWPAHPFGTGARPYVENPFPTVVKLSNIQCVPYRLTFDLPFDLPQVAPLEQFFVRNSDFARFDCDVSVEQDLDFGAGRGDAFQLQQGQSGDPFASLQQFAEYGIGTGAFPFAFRPRRLTRPARHYRCRVAVVPREGGESGQVMQLAPAWPWMRNINQADGICSFDCTDGGMFNNEPLELVRTHLAGWCAHNKRDPRVAKRAVVLIDPLVGFGGIAAGLERASLPSQAGAILGALIGESRYRTADLLLLANEDVFSRFLVRPERRGDALDATRTINRIGDDALAGAGMEAFLGFLSRAFRRHDYLLGRHNAWRFLRDDFVMHRDNPLFKDWGGLKTDRRFTVDGGTYLPVIPLLGRLEDPQAEPQPAWPRPLKRAELKAIERKLHDRFDAVIAAIRNGSAGSLGPFVVLIALLQGAGAGCASRAIADWAEKELRTRRLM